MDLDNPVQREVFFELHDGLPRQGPGSEASTLRALNIMRGRLPAVPHLGDFACGPGASALPLARALRDATVIAFDLHPPFIETLRQRASAAGLARRIDARVADMADPPTPPGGYDLIWCEAAIYALGVESALRLWRPCLKPNGCVVFSEVIWTAAPDDRPIEVADFWADYPAMTDAAGVAARIDAAGYELIGAFDLPESDWWSAYYTPLEQRLDRLETFHAGSQEAMVPLRETRREIALRRAHSRTYAYRFFCTAKRADAGQD